MPDDIDLKDLEKYNEELYNYVCFIMDLQPALATLILLNAAAKIIAEQSKSETAKRLSLITVTNYLIQSTLIQS